MIENDKYIFKCQILRVMILITLMILVDVVAVYKWEFYCVWGALLTSVACILIPVWIIFNDTQSKFVRLLNPVDKSFNTSVIFNIEESYTVWYMLNKVSVLLIFSRYEIIVYIFQWTKENDFKLQTEKQKKFHFM